MPYNLQLIMLIRTLEKKLKEAADIGVSGMAEGSEEYLGDYNTVELIEKELNKLCWYDKKIFELYYGESNTLDSLAKKTGISRNSLFTTIDKVREILKKELND